MLLINSLFNLYFLENGIFFCRMTERLDKARNRFSNPEINSLVEKACNSLLACPSYFNIKDFYDLFDSFDLLNELIHLVRATVKAADLDLPDAAIENLTELYNITLDIRK